MPGPPVSPAILALLMRAHGGGTDEAPDVDDSDRPEQPGVVAAGEFLDAISNRDAAAVWAAFRTLLDAARASGSSDKE